MKKLMIIILAIFIPLIAHRFATDSVKIANKEIMNPLFEVVWEEWDNKLSLKQSV